MIRRRNIFTRPRLVLLAVASCAVVLTATPAFADEVHVTRITTADPGQLTDHDLETVIGQKLKRMTTINARGIQVDSTNGVITLSGSVPSLLEKRRALDTVKSFRGVRGIHDEIQVVKGARQDAAVAEDVAWMLSQDPILQPANITATVENGQVVLRGTVDSWTKKTLATELVQEVAGVTAINNEIQLSYAAPRTDKEIQQDIARQFTATRGLSDDDITIHVNQGQVELHGAVDSSFEADVANNLAWVQGVTGVDSDLQVQFGGSPAREVAVVSDIDLEKIITHRFDERPLLMDEQIDVDVDNGVVTLRGNVSSLRDKQAAIHEVQMTNGVRQVNDRLRIAGGTVDTQSLHDTLHREFASAARLEDDAISVKVEGGTVYLSGEVDSLGEREQATRLVARHIGVTEVVNNLAIPERETLADAELKAAVENELDWSVFVDSDEINVDVEDGVVTMTGTVDDLHEFQAAIENAYEAGARDVVARLQLEDGGIIDDAIRVEAKRAYKRF